MRLSLFVSFILRTKTKTFKILCERLLFVSLELNSSTRNHGRKPVPIKNFHCVSKEVPLNIQTEIFQDPASQT